MPVIENGFRYDAVRDALDKHEGITVVSDITTSRVDERKLRFYDETMIRVAPETGTLDKVDLPDFISKLLPGVEPIFRHEIKQGRLRTFDTVGEKRFRPIIIDVFPSVNAAQQADK